MGAPFAGGSLGVWRQHGDFLLPAEPHSEGAALAGSRPASRRGVGVATVCRRCGGGLARAGCSLGVWRQHGDFLLPERSHSESRADGRSSGSRRGTVRKNYLAADVRRCSRIVRAAPMPVLHAGAACICVHHSPTVGSMLASAVRMRRPGRSCGTGLPGFSGRMASTRGLSPRPALVECGSAGCGGEACGRTGRTRIRRAIGSMPAPAVRMRRLGRSCGTGLPGFSGRMESTRGLSPRPALLNAGAPAAVGDRKSVV